jgi:SAM-dependent methyltransferase
MRKKPYDDKYYNLQNSRSGSDSNANEINIYFNFLRINVTSDFNFLDIGCRAHCEAVKLFYNLGANSYGFDIGENAKNTWHRHPFVNNLKLHDAHEPFLYDFKFDLISISHTLEHCYNPDLVLKNIHDALKINGKVWGIVPVEGKDRDHSPHYATFHAHEEHINIYNTNGFNVTWDLEFNGNSYIIAERL